MYANTNRTTLIQFQVSLMTLHLMLCLSATADKSQITGYVEHSMSDGSVNAALTYIAGQDASELLVAASTSSMLSLLKSWGTPLAKNCTGMTSLQAYTLRGASKYGGDVISFQVSSQYSNLAEYAVFARAPTVEWQCTSKPPGAPDNWQDACIKKYPKGGPAAQHVVSDFAAAHSGIKVALGWGPESAYVAALGERGFYVHASDDSHNMAPIANARLANEYQQATPSPTATGPANTPPAQSSSAPTRAKHKIAFLMSDGDNIQWMYNAFPIQPSWWGSQDRGRVPLGWTLSPGLVELGPVILNYLARTATAKDDFVAAPSGIGYVHAPHESHRCVVNVLHGLYQCNMVTLDGRAALGIYTALPAACAGTPTLRCGLALISRNSVR